MDTTNNIPLAKKGFGFNWKHAALLLLVLFAILFPFYRHIIDVDAIGYITVARYYAAGEWAKAINGYWSPLNSWLMVPMIKLDLNDVLCFKIANVFFGIGALYQTEKLLNKFSYSNKQNTALLLTAMVIVLYYASVQLAADMLFTWIFLMYVNVVLKDDLDTNTKSNIHAGLIGAIAFFAKSYGGIFFILHFTFLHIAWYPFIQKKGWHLQKYIAGMLSFLPLIIVWMILLWNKYHIITFGYSGQLNWSWVLKGGQPDYKEFFYKPPYTGATSRWVDPFYSQARIYSPFQSKELMWQQVKLVGFNFKNTLWSALWISFLSPVLILWIFIKRKLQNRMYTMACIIIIFPLVYLLIFIEERYLWPVSVLLPVAGGCLLQQASFRKKWMWPVLLLSFVVGPVIRLVQAANRDIEVDQLAAIIRQRKLQGPFTALDSGEWMHKAAFLTGNQFFGITRPPKSWEALEAECKANSVEAVCIEMFNRDDAIGFVGSDFYRKYQANTFKVEGRYLWVIELK